MSRLALAALLLVGCTDAGVEIVPAAVDATIELDLPEPDASPPDQDAELDQAVVDMAAADAMLDMPDAAPPFNACDAPDDLASVAERTATGFIYDDITRDDSAGSGSCGGLGADRVLRFTAPSAGTWRVAVEANIPGYEPVVHARRVCADPATELACRDDVAGSPATRIHLPLEADETVFLFVDADNTRGGFFRLVVDPVPVVDADCDPLGFTDACAPDRECVDGACVARTPPRLDTVQVVRHPSGQLGMTLIGFDAGADTQGFLLTPLGNGLPPLTASRLTLRDLPGIINWRLYLRVNVPAIFNRARLLEVVAIDAQANLSEPVVVPIPASTVVGAGKCGAVNVRCPDGTVCRNQQCVAPRRPVIESADAVFNPVDPAMWVQARVAADAEVRRLKIELLDADEGRVEQLTVTADRVVTLGERDTVQVARRLEPLDEVVAFARLTAIGVTDWESVPVTVAVRPAEPRALGEGCDADRALDACPDAATCVEGVCAPIVVECPADFAPRDILGDGPLWRVNGRLDGDVIETGLSCGGSANSVVYRFEAPADGDYLITAYSGELASDPVLAIRSHCGYSGRSHPEFELACSDDALRRDARLSIPLTAGQVVYPVVDGHGRWRGGYRLRIERR